jgi:cell division transport system permease protein
MIGLSFFRVFKASLQNVMRNIWLTVATALIMIMTLLVVMFLYFANVFGLEVIKSVEQKIDLSVVFRDEIDMSVIGVLEGDVKTWKDVKAVKVISSEEALEIFKQRNKDKPFIEESLNELGDNPLPASMFIVADDPSSYESIASRLSAEHYSPIIEEVQYEDSRAVIERLITVISTIKNAAVIVTIMFALLVILIMYNTVRLAIYSFREEIDIMRLVGASRWYIRGPFVIESILVALVSVAITSGLIFATLRKLSPHLQRFFFEGYAQGGSFNILEYAISNWTTVIGLQVSVAVGLAIISSLIAVQRYLKV